MKDKKSFTITMYVLNIFFAVIIMLPVLYCFNVSMMDLKEIYGGKFFPSRLTLENYQRALQLAPFFTFLKNSLIVSAAITAAQVVTGALAAYAFSMMKFKGKNVLFMIMLATMMIPSQAIIIANYLTIADWGIRNTYTALILPNAAAAFAVFNMRQAFLGLPMEIKEAADIDGCSTFKFLYKVAIPLIKPSLGALIIYVFLQSWNYYLWPLLVTDSVNMRTVQIGLGMLTGAEATDYRPVMAGAMIILVPSILVFIIGQKQMISGLTAGAVKG
jgi:sn-glycerol 3-phosphate transport system permease protein